MSLSSVYLATSACESFHVIHTQSNLICDNAISRQVDQSLEIADRIRRTLSGASQSPTYARPPGLAIIHCTSGPQAGAGPRPAGLQDKLS